MDAEEKRRREEYGDLYDLLFSDQPEPEPEPDWREKYPEFYDLLFSEPEYPEPPKRVPVTREQPGELPTELTTEDEFEVGLLLHYRRQPHLGKECPLCLIEFDRNGFQRKYVSAVVSEDAATERYKDIIAVLSYASVVDINTVLSYLSYDALIAIFAGVNDTV